MLDKKIMKYKVEDILVNNRHSKYKILGICNQIYFLSKSNNFDQASPYPMTQQELDDNGYRLLSKAEDIPTNKDSIIIVPNFPYPTRISYDLPNKENFTKWMKSCLTLEQIDIVYKELLENYGYRIGQAVFNHFGIIDELSKKLDLRDYFHIEDYELLYRLGNDPKEYMVWGKNKDKDGKLLEETIYVPINQLGTSHLENILKLDYMNEAYRYYMKEELEVRKGNSVK